MGKMMEKPAEYQRATDLLPRIPTISEIEGRDVLLHTVTFREDGPFGVEATVHVTEINDPFAEPRTYVCSGVIVETLRKLLDAMESAGGSPVLVTFCKIKTKNGRECWSVS